MQKLCNELAVRTIVTQLTLSQHKFTDWHIVISEQKILSYFVQKILNNHDALKETLIEHVLDL